MEGEDGTPLKPGVAYIAPGGWHMQVVRSEDGYQLKLDQEEPISGHRRPSTVCLCRFFP